jgi:hypothetical protein
MAMPAQNPDGMKNPNFLIQKGWKDVESLANQFYGKSSLLFLCFVSVMFPPVLLWRGMTS